MRAQLTTDAHLGPYPHAHTTHRRLDRQRRRRPLRPLWRGARGAFAVFRPDGQLNDRSWAAAEVAAALPGLKGAAWPKLRGFLQDGRASNFLDVLPRDLAAAEPRAGLRQALVQLGRLRSQRRGREAGAPAAVLAVPLPEVICAKWAADWQLSYQRVSRVLGRVVRASSSAGTPCSLKRRPEGGG